MGKSGFSLPVAVIESGQNRVVNMIVQNGHNFFGNSGNSDVPEPKSFLAHLRENLETGLFVSSTTSRPKVAYPIMADTAVVPSLQELEAQKLSRIFGDKKVTTFYLHMSIAISTFIVLIFIGVTGYYFYKRREFQSLDHTPPEAPRRRSSTGPRRKSSPLNSEKVPINLR